MYNLNVPETNIILTLLKTCCCNKNIDNVVVTQLKKCYNDENEMWLKCVAILTYHKKFYLNVVTVVLLKGTWNKVVAN